MVSQVTNPYAGLIGQYAQQYGVPADYALRIAHVENAPGNPNIVSPAGARGLMQIMPATAAGYGVQPQQLFDPNTNVQTGVHLLADLLHRYNGNQQLASIAYNAGPGWANRYQNGSIGLAGLPQETQNYLARLGITPMPVQTAQNQIPGAQVTAPVPAPPATTGFGWGGTLPGQNLTMAAAGSGFNGYGTTGAGNGYTSSGSAPGSAPSAGAHIGTARTSSPFGLDRALGLYLPGWANIG